MDLILFSFNINLFTQGSILTPESKSIMKLMPFINEDFFPSHGEGINNETGVSSKVLKVEKEMDGCRLSVVFAPWAISIIVESRSFVECSQVISKVEYLINLLNNCFGDKSIMGSRLATILTVGLKNTPELDEVIYNKYFKGETRPFEWSFRQAHTSKFEDEDTFNIVSVNKGHATIGYGGVVFDGDAIVVNVDNNTLPVNTVKRFSLGENSFLNNLITKTIGDFLSIRGE
ncbi:hypothetical protein ACU6ZH_11865 [Klebsiella aerogenes]|nr:hypothetical protein [Klebsiella aerogenes]